MNRPEEVRRLSSPKCELKNVGFHDEAIADRLSGLAHAKVLTALKGYGNLISPTHDQALLELSHALSRQALRVRPGRFAYAMPCGAGKTQSVVAWVAAAHELGLELSVAISAFQIRALSSIKLDLMAAGVPESKIGLRHSLGSSDKLLPDTGDEDRPIMLVSHARIRGQRESSLFRATLNKFPQCGAPGFGMGCKAQSTAIAGYGEHLQRCRPPKAGLRCARGTCSALP